jgi:hypothetical protein
MTSSSLYAHDTNAGRCGYKTNDIAGFSKST